MCLPILSKKQDVQKSMFGSGKGFCVGAGPQGRTLEPIHRLCPTDIKMADWCLFLQKSDDVNLEAHGAHDPKEPLIAIWHTKQRVVALSSVGSELQ